MGNNIDKTLILNRIKEAYNLAGNSELSRFLGVAPNTITNWYNRNSIDYDLIFPKCDKLNLEWLFTGKGSMLKEEVPVAVQSKIQNIGIPLIPIEAMAGFGNGESQVLEYECERYVVPMFKDAEFLIQVKGSSMYPKYNSGDIVACKKLPLSNLFFQWNKVYVLDTVQGALIKRIKKGTEPDHILIVSDNEKYEPFELNVNQIHSISIVIGVIRLE